MINLFAYFNSIRCKIKNISTINKDAINIKYEEVSDDIKDLMTKLKLFFN